MFPGGARKNFYDYSTIIMTPLRLFLYPPLTASILNYNISSWKFWLLNKESFQRYYRFRLNFRKLCDLNKFQRILKAHTTRLEDVEVAFLSCYHKNLWFWEVAMSNMNMFYNFRHCTTNHPIPPPSSWFKSCHVFCF